MEIAEFNVVWNSASIVVTTWLLYGYTLVVVVVVVVVVEGLVTGDAMFPFRVSDIPITNGYCGKPCPRFAR